MLIMEYNIVLLCRTARGNEYGTALTFVCPAEETKLTELQSFLKERKQL